MPPHSQFGSFSDISSADGPLIPYINHPIIYNLVEDVKQLISNTLIDPLNGYYLIGQAQVMALFPLKTGNNNILGCKCTLGSLVKGSFQLPDGNVADSAAASGVIARVLRDEHVIWEGKLQTLKHYKNEEDGSVNKWNSNV